jgi:thiosulfate sulfurtransferase
MFKRISAKEAKELIDTKDVNLVDVRDPRSYESGHLAGAVNVQDDNLDEYLRTADKAKPTLVYCYHGNSSQGGAAYFFDQGFEEVYSVDGGFEAWPYS